jgi:ribosomal protein S10
LVQFCALKAQTPIPLPAKKKKFYILKALKEKAFIS